MTRIAADHPSDDEMSRTPPPHASLDEVGAVVPNRPRTSKMSHDRAWRDSCASTRHDKHGCWFWRLVGRFFHPTRKAPWLSYFEEMRPSYRASASHYANYQVLLKWQDLDRRHSHRIPHPQTLWSRLSARFHKRCEPQELGYPEPSSHAAAQMTPDTSGWFGHETSGRRLGEPNRPNIDRLSEADMADSH